MTVCAYWNCYKEMSDKVLLCHEHGLAMNKGIIDQCPRCGRFKDIRQKYCSTCQYGRPVAAWRRIREIHKPDSSEEMEHSEKRKKGDKVAPGFYVYVMELYDGTFYIGHSRELRQKIYDHRNGKVKSTVGRQPKLVYFEILPGREDVTRRETELKKIRSSNPRELTRMLIQFKDLISELAL